MTHLHNILLFLIIVPITIKHESVAAIKCWTCQSNVDPKCADPFDNSTLPITDCDSYVRDDLGNEGYYESLRDKEHYSRTQEHLKIQLRPRFCRKVRQKVNGEWRTIRDCAYIGDARDENGDGNNCHMRRGVFDTFMEECTCRNKDGCNGGLNSLPSLVVITVMSLLVIFSVPFRDAF